MMLPAWYYAILAGLLLGFILTAALGALTVMFPKASAKVSSVLLHRRVGYWPSIVLIGAGIFLVMQ